MRKTGAYRVYTQSNYNIGLVMHLLNHSSEAMTLTYLGLDQASRETMLAKINDKGRQSLKNSCIKVLIAAFL